ncbi:MAG: hypothetical protein A3K41_06715 [Chloroflexi bacterium RIFOXYD12_FULL_57_15]|nr:MAG: hypothetical protein A3K41_06715 [Chloroflexi bacterium RIFOXYD12_FULL_57_15]
MNLKSKRQQSRERQRKQKFRTNLIWGGIGAVGLAIIGIIIWQGVRPASGESIPVMATTHIPVDSDPGTYNSDPPTSGPHYAEEARAGFHETNNYQYPAGYLVHNLEHGYVIFWYNCDLLDETGCADLKEKIKTTMDELGGAKLIAYPWPSLDMPLVITSWGRLQRFETFDSEQAKAFYRANLNRAPEPNAP